MSERPWIEHDGSGRPVARGTLVDVVRRGGMVAYATPVQVGALGADGTLYIGKKHHGSTWDWGTSYPKYRHLEVIRYRLSKPDDTAERREARIEQFRKMAEVNPADVRKAPVRETVKGAM